MADPDLELGGGGLDLLALSAIFPSVISSFFTQNKGGESRAPRAPPLDPPCTVIVILSKGKGVMRFTLREASTREASLLHNTGN